MAARMSVPATSSDKGVTMKPTDAFVCFPVMGPRATVIYRPRLPIRAKSYMRRHSQTSAAAARIVLYLHLRRPHGLAAQQHKRAPVCAAAFRQRRRAHTVAAFALQELLDDAVFERMKADHH